MIEGVMIKKLKVIPDERGRLMEILRVDDETFKGFGQVYMTTAYPGVVKGMMKIVLYDNRKDSPTYGEINEFYAGEHNPILVHIPPHVCHGFTCISTEEALVINIPTEPYHYEDPDEFRIHPHDNDIPYKWGRKDG
jgi:dTDP-4-dehydrorhamnose 3,5-epimerase